MFDDLKNNPATLVSEIQDHLGVKKILLEDLNKKHNVSNVAKVPAIDAVAWAMKKGLARIPFPFKEQLKNLL